MRRLFAGHAETFKSNEVDSNAEATLELTGVGPNAATIRPKGLEPCSVRGSIAISKAPAIARFPLEKRVEVGLRRRADHGLHGAAEGGQPPVLAGRADDL